VILYLDTSALVKLYIEEACSQEVKKAVHKSQIVSTSRVAYVEARAGIARKYREGEFSNEEYDQVVGDLVRDWDNYFIMEVSESVAKLGGILAERQSLRGFDAIHLASAIILRDRARLDVAFSCFDERLKAAAVAEGLSVIG
jgi:predicted nucleic acid-binding protein